METTLGIPGCPAVCIITCIVWSGTTFGSETMPEANMGLVVDSTRNWYGQELHGIMDVNGSLPSLHPVVSSVRLGDTFSAMRTLCKEVGKLEKPQHVVFAALECDSLSYVTSVLSHMRVPTITTTQGKCVIPQNNLYLESKTTYEIELSVGRTHVVEVLSHLISTQNWKNIIIFYDTYKASTVLHDLLVTSLPLVNVTAATFEIPENASHLQLEKIIESAKRNPEFAYPYVVLTSENTTEDLLREAHIHRLVGSEYRWLLGGNYPVDTIIPFLENEDNLVFISRGNDENMHQEATEMMKETYQSVIDTYAKLSAQDEWPTPSSYRPTTGCASPIPEGSRHDIATAIKRNLPRKSQFNDTYAEYRLLSAVARMDRKPEMEHVASWTSDKELQWKEALFPNSFNGFNNRTFIVSSLEYSFFQRKEYNADGSFKWVGLTFTLLDELAKDLNFSYVVEEPPDKMWGIREDTGQWNGMIAEVINQTVDFAAACFSITADRETVVDFAEPYFHELSAVIVKRPESANKLTLYLKPFTWQVWVSCVSAVIIYGAILWLVTRTSPYYEGRTGSAEWEYGAFSAKNALLYFYGSFVQQGGIWLPMSQSGRVLVGCFWFFVIVIVATYTGNLIAFLAVNTVSLPFNNLAEMVKQSATQYGTAEGVALVMLFRDADFEPYSSVNKGMTLVPGYSVGLQRVKDGGYAFIAEKSYYQAEVAKDCNLAMIKETFYPTNYGWAFPTKSSYLKLFNDRINKMREAGLLAHWTQKWTPRALNCTGLKPMTNAKVVDLTDFQGAIYVLGFGCFVGMVTLVTEFIFFLNRRRKFKTILPHHKDNGVTTPNMVVRDSRAATDGAADVAKADGKVPSHLT